MVELAPPSALAAAAAILRNQGFDALIDVRRSILVNRWEPWLPDDCRHLAAPSAGTEPAALVRLLHLGSPVAAHEVTAETAEVLTAAGLCDRKGADLLPGRWQLTAYRGLLAVAGREYGGSAADVHLGEDSLRFTDAVLRAAPTGTVLDIGSGSGICAVAASRTAAHVVALDVLEDARTAGELTAALNGGGTLNGGAACRFTVADFREITGDQHFDVAIANLPGVPVPAGMPYPAAGNGGPDGLALISPLWDWFAGPRSAERMVMRFQSLGDAAAPAVLAELASRFGASCQIRVITDSAVPVVVRDAITAERVAGLSGRTAAAVLAEIGAARTRAGHTHFHCSTAVFDRRAAPGLWHLRNHPRLELNRSYGRADSDPDVHQLGTWYLAQLSLMPDEFWSLDGGAAGDRVYRQLPELARALAEGATAGQLAAAMPAREGRATSPTALAGDALAVALLAWTLVGAGVLAAPSPSRSLAGVAARG
ncbi:MAG TPA: 50S ribosomal protein L11 methyltransferase [Jatrophihabitantaceae bacterium]|nr:50S ribosomal protein L11 methyltransferase [Jatrophihabitantaceae bacterium]